MTHKTFAEFQRDTIIICFHDRGFGGMRKPRARWVLGNVCGTALHVQPRHTSRGWIARYFVFIRGVCRGKVVLTGRLYTSRAQAIAAGYVAACEDVHIYKV